MEILETNFEKYGAFWGPLPILQPKHPFVGCETSVHQCQVPKAEHFTEHEPGVDKIETVVRSLNSLS